MEEIIKIMLKKENEKHGKIFDKVLSILTNSEKIKDSFELFSEQVKEKYNINYEIESFQEKHFSITNANAKKDYSFTFDLQEFPNIKITKIDNIEVFNLSFDNQSNTITGKPLVAATTQLDIYFYCTTDDTKTTYRKTIPFIINADPKDLWQNMPFPKDSLFYKKDEDSYSGTFLDKKIVVASKRGRSHAHQGSSRDDDFYTLKLPNEWETIAVADGAGSAKFARKGSEEATKYICNSFNDEFFISSIDKLVIKYFSEKLTQEELLKCKNDLINTIYPKVKDLLYKHLKEISENENITIKDLNTTLIFALSKKFPFGYVLLTFGVGDCPISILDKDENRVELLNILDIGEFGGGTRFVTMPEIYSNEASIPIGKRFGIFKFEDFSKLFLMTDGIYDPKFVVENNLTQIDKWKDFLNDLNGQNEDLAKVDFQNDENIAEQLLHWLDFWSKGNSDDRTLAIIY